MGNIYLYLATCTAAVGGLLFGYDIGVISGVLVMQSFKDTFKFSEDGFDKGFIVSSLTLGCFLGSWVASYLADKFGRRISILIGSIVFTVGACLQTFSSDIGGLYAGRIIAGLAVGELSMVVPLYQSEIAPKEHRGLIISLQQLAITIGILVSFLINYGCESLEGNKAWQIPMGIQGIISVLLAIGMIFLPYSPRWLCQRGREEEALQVLAKVAGKSTENTDVREDFEEIKESIRHEKEIGDGSWGEIFSKDIRGRTLLGVMIQGFQQLTGINAIMYYAPSVFEMAGLGSKEGLLATAITGAVNVAATFPGMYLVDKAGRRILMISGAIMMATGHIAVGIFISIIEGGNKSEALGYLSIVFVCFFVASFAFSWGPIAWVYPAEIFPMRVRAKAMSTTTASNWLFNFIIGLIVPTVIKNIGWGIFLIFGGFCLIMTAWTFFIVHETKGKSLEEIDALFISGKSPRRAEKIPKA